MLPRTYYEFSATTVEQFDYFLCFTRPLCQSISIQLHSDLGSRHYRLGCAMCAFPTAGKGGIATSNPAAIQTSSTECLVLISMASKAMDTDTSVLRQANSSFSEDD